jgi:exodeoxyribonuclease V gamma subunit
VGLPLTTAVVASDDTLLLDPLPLDQAQTALSDLLLAWQTGMTRPLPVAVKTAVAWLSQTDEEKALAAARKAYEGDGVTSNGERREAVALMRQFADFDALVDSEEFEGWAQTLYQPMLEAPWRSVDEQEARS